VDEAVIRIYPEDEADFVDGSGVAPETAFRFWISDRGFGAESAPDHFIGMDMGSPPADERRSVLIQGAGGDDRIELMGEMGLGAGASNDFRSEATGGPGDDVILGSAGADFLLGESGEDEVTAGGGVDTASGETVRGNGGADSLFGTSSFGGRGADALYGGGRNDAPTSLHGGVGNDSFELHSHRYRKHQPLRNAPDDVFGGEGLDTATYEFCGRCEIRLDGEANDGSAEDGPVEGDNLRVENVAVYSRKDNPRFEKVYGPGDDRLVGDREDNRLFSSDGPDRVVGKGGSDKIATGDGRDVILAADGERDTVLCGKGADRVIADRADRIRNDCEDVVFR
jgi:Ca2+-binding RTX toxin-like protein